MENKLKLNIFLKIMTVFIVGYFIFDFIFSIITGNYITGSNMTGESSHHAAGGNGTQIFTFTELINALMVLLIKLLVVLLFLLIIAGIAKWIKYVSITYYEKRSKTSKNTSTESNSLLLITGSAIAILFVISIFNGFYINDQSTSSSLITSRQYLYSTFTPMLSSYRFLNFMLNIIIYLVAILLGVKLYLYLRNLMEKSSISTERRKV